MVRPERLNEPVESKEAARFIATMRARLDDLEAEASEESPHA